jgi:hypothetical protein
LRAYQAIGDLAGRRSTNGKRRLRRPDPLLTVLQPIGLTPYKQLTNGFGWVGVGFSHREGLADAVAEMIGHRTG